MLLELDDYIAMIEIHIYTDNPLKTLGRGGSAEVGGLSTS
jgi:hypothetical protein